MSMSVVMVTTGLVKATKRNCGINKGFSRPVIGREQMCDLETGDRSFVAMWGMQEGAWPDDTTAPKQSLFLRLSKNATVWIIAQKACTFTFNISGRGSHSAALGSLTPSGQSCSLFFMEHSGVNSGLGSRGGYF